jgi:hypothetical protein
VLADKLAPMATTNNGAKEIDASTNSWTGARIPMFEGKAPQVPPAAPPSIGSSSKTSSSRPAPASYQYHIGETSWAVIFGGEWGVMQVIYGNSPSRAVTHFEQLHKF